MTDTGDREMRDAVLIVAAYFGALALACGLLLWVVVAVVGRVII